LPRKGNLRDPGRIPADHALACGSGEVIAP
jgi:hypothetical protein